MAKDKALLVSWLILTSVWSGFATLLGAQDAAEKAPFDPDGIERRAAELRPAPERLKWQRIPWMTNLAEGLAAARREGRPLFLWGSDDEPLERC